MRILMLSETCHLGGAEVMLRNLSLELRQRGHEVGLVAPSNGGPWLHQQMERDGFPVWQFPLKGAVNPTLVRCINRAISEFKPDVMHSHLWVMAAYGGMVAFGRRVPHVITMHGDDEQTRYLRRRVALRIAFTVAKKVVAVSEAMRNDLVAALGTAADRILVVGNGSSLPQGDRARIRSSLPVGDDSFVVLCVGSQGPRKNHLTVLRALAELREDIDWRMVVAGPEGEATIPFAEAVAQLGVQERVHNLGPRSDVPDLLAACDLFVMPSLWEGMPVALVEAMGAGRPVIASRVGGIPDMITDGTSGILLDNPTDVNTLSRLVDQLYRDPAHRQRLGSHARAKAISEYGVGAMTDTYLRLYEKDGR